MDQRAARTGVDGAVLAPDEIEHQLDIVIELDAEPIPADLIFRQLVAAEFMIHPTLSPDSLRLSADLELALRLEAREGIIMSGPAFALSFLTVPPVAMQ